MRKSLTFVIVGIILMGLFSLFTEKIYGEPDSNSGVLGMVLLKEANSLDIKKAVQELRDKWNLTVDDTESGEEASILIINNYKIAIINISAAIPGDEIAETADYNYLWQNGGEETTKHEGHIILTFMNGGKNPVQENILYSKLVSAVLNNSKSIGIYIGDRTLLLKSEFYLSNIENISEKHLPLLIWIYFGIRREGDLLSIYTYGLKDFGKMEMEIVNSSHSFAELQEMMFDLAHYVIASDVVLKDGETVGISAEQKLKITESKGKYLEGTTIKIEY